MSRKLNVKTSSSSSFSALWDLSDWISPPSHQSMRKLGVSIEIEVPSSLLRKFQSKLHRNYQFYPVRWLITEQLSTYRTIVQGARAQFLARREHGSGYCENFNFKTSAEIHRTFAPVCAGKWLAASLSPVSTRCSRRLQPRAMMCRCNHQ